MKIQAPLRHVRRMRATCFCEDGSKYCFSTSFTGQAHFEVEDNVVALLYTAIEIGNVEGARYLWENGVWASLESEVAQARLDEIENPKPVVPDPVVPEVVEPPTLTFPDMEKLPSMRDIVKKYAPEFERKQ